MASTLTSRQSQPPNAVGYSQIDINKEYTLLTINFDDVGGETLTIQKAFPFVEGMTEAKVSGSADNIQVMNADGGYDIYFFHAPHTMHGT